jgi:hypothetical protein
MTIDRQIKVNGLAAFGRIQGESSILLSSRTRARQYADQDNHRSHGSTKNCAH